MRNRLNVFFLAMLVLTLQSCAPGLGKTLRVDYIDAVDEALPAAGTDLPLSDVRVRLGSFVDKRTKTAIAEIDGRRLEPEGDIGESVKRGLEDALRARGAGFSLYGKQGITGEVTAWYAKIIPDFPLSRVEARASLTLRTGPINAPAVYSAQFSGAVETQHPFLSETRVEKALGDAMAAALQEALSDGRLISEIKAGAVH